METKLIFASSLAFIMRLTVTRKWPFVSWLGSTVSLVCSLLRYRLFSQSCEPFEELRVVSLKASLSLHLRRKIRDAIEMQCQGPLSIETALRTTSGLFFLGICHVTHTTSSHVTQINFSLTWKRFREGMESLIRFKFLNSER